jgi:hypothetical protein
MTMRSTKSLIAAILGVAMLATPITASAAEHHRARVNVARAAAIAPRSLSVRNTAPARSFAATRWFAPRAFVNNRAERLFARRQYRNFNAAPVYAGNGVVTPVYPSYGYSNVAPVPAVGYMAPAPTVGYTQPYYGSSCAAAERAVKIAQHDRKTGHPAAANDVLRNHSRELASCQGIGALPAYGSYGYNAPYAASPYGYGTTTMIAPLLQSFVR